MTFTKEDAITGVFDNALTTAEEWLEELLPTLSVEEIKERFAQHVKTHLGVELENIKDHGHRHDDPEFNRGEDFEEERRRIREQLK